MFLLGVEYGILILKLLSVTPHVHDIVSPPFIYGCTYVRMIDEVETHLLHTLALKIPSVRIHFEGASLVQLQTLGIYSFKNQTERL